MADIDLDSILAQRAEASGGQPDEIAFTFAGERWTCPHPMLADDEWKQGLEDLSDSDVEMARYYLGSDQYERFRAAGGRAGYVLLVIQEVARSMRDEMPGGANGEAPRPTQRSVSSARRRKR